MNSAESLPGEPFIAFAPSHLAIIGLVVGLTALVCWLGRRGSHIQELRWFEKALGIALLLDWPLSLIIGWYYGLLDLDNALPFHLCSFAGFAVGIALLRPHTTLAELGWCWGLGGTLNGLLTPNLTLAFPHPAFFRFFLLHGGVVLGAIYLVIGKRLYPKPGSWWRVMLWSELFVLFNAVMNWLLGTNYGFLCHPPESASLIDHLGPWPWYLLSLQAIAAVLFALLLLPFRWVRKNHLVRSISQE